MGYNTFLSITLVPVEIEQFYLHKQWLDFDFQSNGNEIFEYLSKTAQVLILQFTFCTYCVKLNMLINDNNVNRWLSSVVIKV